MFYNLPEVINMIDEQFWMLIIVSFSTFKGVTSNIAAVRQVTMGTKLMGLPSQKRRGRRGEEMVTRRKLN